VGKLKKSLGSQSFFSVSEPKQGNKISWILNINS